MDIGLISTKLILTWSARSSQASYFTQQQHIISYLRISAFLRLFALLLMHIIFSLRLAPTVCVCVLERERGCVCVSFFGKWDIVRFHNTGNDDGEDSWSRVGAGPGSGPDQKAGGIRAGEQGKGAWHRGSPGSVPGWIMPVRRRVKYACYLWIRRTGIVSRRFVWPRCCPIRHKSW